jgi:hypothetical protein
VSGINVSPRLLSKVEKYGGKQKRINPTFKQKTEINRAVI